MDMEMQDRAVRRAPRLAGLWCCLVLAGLLTPAGAQPKAEDAEPASELTLSQAVELALKNNRQVNIADQGLSAARHDLAATRTTRLPQLGVAAYFSQQLIQSGSNFQNFPSFGPLPSILGGNSLPSGFLHGSVVQPITNLQTIHLKIRLARAQVDAAEQTLRLQEQQVATSVKQAYDSLLQIQGALDANEESVRYYTEVARTTANFVEEQTALKAQLLTVRAQLAAQEQQTIVLRNNYATGQEQLNYLLGRDVRTPFRVTEPPAPPASPEDLAELEQLALEQRPELKQATIQVRAARINRRLALAEFTPDLSAGLTYLRPVNISLLPPNILNLGLLMTWEPYDWGRRRQQAKSKARAVDQAELNRDDVESQVIMDVRTAFRNLQAAQNQLAVARAAQEAARETVRVAVARYGEKAILLQDVLQTQSALASANAAYQGALSGYLTAEANLARAIGEAAPGEG